MPSSRKDVDGHDTGDDTGDVDDTASRISKISMQLSWIVEQTLKRWTAQLERQPVFLNM
jgi:hypothetical protein